MVAYSRDAKMYMPLWVFCALSMACLLWWLRTNLRMAWLLWILTGVAAVGLHATALIIVAIQPLAFLITGRWKLRIALLFLSGIGVISAGPIGYYTCFNHWVQQMRSVGWETSGVAWIGRLDSGADALLSTAIRASQGAAPLKLRRRRRGGLPRDHARLASGCRPALPGGVGYPLGSSERFWSYMTSSFPRLILTHSRFPVELGRSSGEGSIWAVGIDIKQDHLDRLAALGRHVLDPAHDQADGRQLGWLAVQQGRSAAGDRGHFLSLCFPRIAKVPVDHVHLAWIGIRINKTSAVEEVGGTSSGDTADAINIRRMCLICNATPIW